MWLLGLGPMQQCPYMGSSRSRDSLRPASCLRARRQSTETSSERIDTLDMFISALGFPVSARKQDVRIPAGRARVSVAAARRFFQAPRIISHIWISPACTAGIAQNIAAPAQKSGIDAGRGDAHGWSRGIRW